MVIWATQMLVTDVGDKICWRHFWDVGNGFGWFCRQHPIYFSISVHQHPKDVTNIEILSPTPENCHQHPLVTNIYVAQPSDSVWESPVRIKMKLISLIFSQMLNLTVHLFCCNVNYFQIWIKYRYIFCFSKWEMILICKNLEICWKGFHFKSIFTNQNVCFNQGSLDTDVLMPAFCDPNLSW